MKNDIIALGETTEGVLNIVLRTLEKENSDFFTMEYDGI